jgi:pSer/pThr/pTyr-binding forkhead associated (FHA) protein
VVITILQDSFLEDLDSTNGTIVNGKQIAKHPLSNGDVISLGRNSLKYEGEQAGAEDDFEKTMILKPGQFGAAFDSQVNKATAPLASESAPAAPAASQAKPVLGKLRVASGANAGKELELSKALTTIGRPGVQVAAITRRTDGYYIVHVGGQTGGKRPLVNGREIDSQAYKLSNNDLIELAGTQMKFLLV